MRHRNPYKGEETQDIRVAFHYLENLCEKAACGGLLDNALLLDKKERDTHLLTIKALIIFEVARDVHTLTGICSMGCLAAGVRATLEHRVQREFTYWRMTMAPKAEKARLAQQTRFLDAVAVGRNV